MPKVEATIDVLVDIANHVYMGQLRSLHIRRYKTGANAGKLFAEYSLKDPSTKFNQVDMQERGVVSKLINQAALAISKGKTVELYVLKRSPAQERYNRSLRIKEDRINDAHNVLSSS